MKANFECTDVNNPDGPLENGRTLTSQCKLLATATIPYIAGEFKVTLPIISSSGHYDWFANLGQ